MQCKCSVDRDYEHMKKRCHTHQLDGEVNPQRLVYIFKTLFGGSLFVSLDVEAE